MAQLPDDEVQAYLEQISATGKIYAKAAAKQKATEENRKMTKAALMKMARTLGEATSREGAEAWAYTHPQYKEASDAMISAIENEIITKTENENAIREWESWRTLCANERNITR